MQLHFIAVESSSVKLKYSQDIATNQKFKQVKFYFSAKLIQLLCSC